MGEEYQFKSGLIVGGAAIAMSGLMVRLSRQFIIKLKEYEK